VEAVDSEDPARAVSSLVAAEMGGDTDVAFHIDIKDAHVRPSIALRLYHAIRIRVANTLTYAHASDVWISIFSESDEVVLLLRDDGVGWSRYGRIGSST